MTLEELRALRPITASQRQYVPPPFANPQKAEGSLPVMVTGGVGDLFLALPLLEALRERCGKLRVYTKFHDLYDFLTGEKSERGMFSGYDYWMSVNCIPRFFLEKNVGHMPAGVARMWLNWESFHLNPIWGPLINWHPGMDNEVGRQALKEGWNRRTLPFQLLGLEPPKHPYRLSIPAPAQDLEPYITVHDGYEDTQKGLVGGRATKTWNLRNWAAFVKQFKQLNPDKFVIQLGGATSRQIPGVDIDLRGKMTIIQSLKVLARSSLHVDGDSGLAHAATAFSVPSVVMFGPTPKDFFGYPENENISGASCGECWWLKENWLSHCPLGYENPVCMDDIPSGAVVAAANRLLRKERTHGNERKRTLNVLHREDLQHP